MPLKESELLKDALELIDYLVRDSTLPRNVRAAISRARDELLRKDEPLDVRISSATYIIDDVSNDVNLPMHARSELWNLASSLEEAKNK